MNCDFFLNWLVGLKRAMCCALLMLPATWGGVRSGLLRHACGLFRKTPQPGWACLSASPPRSSSALASTQPSWSVWMCTLYTSEASRPRRGSRAGWGRVSSVATRPSWWSLRSFYWSIPAPDKRSVLVHRPVEWWSHLVASCYCPPWAVEANLSCKTPHWPSLSLE